MYFHSCENRDTNSSAVSLQGFSKEASGAGMDSLIEHKTGWLWDPVYNFLYRINKIPGNVITDRHQRILFLWYVFRIQA